MFDDLRELYQEVILDHSKNPRNFRHPPDANREAKGENPLCGDRLIVYLTVDGDVVRDAAFLGNGCAISKASASMMTDLVKGKTTDEAKALFESFHHLCTHDDPPSAADHVHEEDLEKLQVLSGVRQFPVRVKCATLAWHAMDAAMAGGGKATTE
ncbi:MAG TPA: SUF system NifU family Fe-S cluster assembly protein [Azospirillaceae bacterium]|nr:SUF system NifU family Fe-S cluster assembly protein [Azospirillaceae bacterium]